MTCTLTWTDLTPRWLILHPEDHIFWCTASILPCPRMPITGYNSVSSWSDLQATLIRKLDSQSSRKLLTCWLLTFNFILTSFPFLLPLSPPLLSSPTCSQPPCRTLRSMLPTTTHTVLPYHPMVRPSFTNTTRHRLNHSPTRTSNATQPIGVSLSGTPSTGSLSTNRMEPFQHRLQAVFTLWMECMLILSRARLECLEYYRALSWQVKPRILWLRCTRRLLLTLTLPQLQRAQRSNWMMLLLDQFTRTWSNTTWLLFIPLPLYPATGLSGLLYQVKWNSLLFLTATPLIFLFLTPILVYNALWRIQGPLLKFLTLDLWAQVVECRFVSELQQNSALQPPSVQLSESELSEH